MPVIITKEGSNYYLVPAPLVSFSRETYNNVGRPAFGATFNLTLEGTLVPNKGNPFYDMTEGSTQPGDAVAADDSNAWTKPSRAAAGADNEPSYGYDADQLLAASIRKQEKIRSLFSNNSTTGSGLPIIVNITNWGETTGGLKFAAFVNNVEFGSDGRGVNPQTYTVSLRCDNFLDSADGNFGAGGNELNPTYAVTDVSESFDIAEGDGINITFAGNGLNTSIETVNKIYNVSRSINAVGAPIYDSNGAYVSGEPWQQASGFIYNVLGTGITNLPSARHEFVSQLGGGLWKTANRTINESVDQEAGSYSYNETFTAYTGYPVIHTISVDVETAENQRNTVSVQGTIQGLNTADSLATTGNAFFNAKNFNALLNPTGNNLDGSPIIPSGYFYAKHLAELGWLHPRPRSKSIGRDIAGGSMSYSYSFDDRPPNLVSGSISEVISINDTYPGELFSATPVIGRNQPILQYLNSRSEYKRNLSINVIMGSPQNGTGDNWTYGDVSNGYWSAASQGNIQKWLLDDKPSRIVMSSGDLATIFAAANPVNDPNFTVRTGKCFHSAPSESWDAFARSYSYSIEWTYEREV